MSDKRRVVGNAAMIAPNDVNFKEHNSRTRCKETSGKSRRWRLMERRGCFGEPPQGVHIYRATSVDDLCETFRLVHDSFVEQGYMDPRPNGLRVRAFETLPEAPTFVAKANGRIVGATTLVPDSPDFGMPLDQAFFKEVNDLRVTGRVLSEGTNWVIAPEYRHTSILTELMRCCWAHTVWANWDNTFAAVSPGHGSFYELLGFDIVGTERSYSEKTNDPVIMADLKIDGLLSRFDQLDDRADNDLSALKQYYMDNSPYHQHIETWEEAAKAAFSDPDFLHELFVDRTDFLPHCSDHDLRRISGHWGAELLANVWSPTEALSKEAVAV